MNAPVHRLALASATPFAPEPSYAVEIVRGLDQLMQVQAVRALVYMGDQGCPYAEEFDGNDLCGATHLLLRCGREPVGVVRLRWFGEFAKLERLAVLKAHRGGPGLLMLCRAAFDLSAKKGYRRLIGHAQVRGEAFWKRYFKGDVRIGRAPFSFSGHDYIEMEFDLSPPKSAICIDTDPFVLLRPEGAWDRPGVLDPAPDAPEALRAVG